MNISRNNYEIYFLDYYEKNLSPEQIAELMEFLNANTDLKKEFNEFEMISLDKADEIEFPLKSNLKKKVIPLINVINMDNYTDYMISFIEGNLNENEAESLNQFIRENPKMQKELDTFRRTRLSPDMSIIFPDKSSLKHIAAQTSYFRPQTSVFRIKYAGYAFAIAASISVIVGLFFILNNNTKNQLSLNRQVETRHDLSSKSQVESKNSEEKNPKSEISNQKSYLANSTKKLQNNVSPLPTPSSQLETSDLIRIKPHYSSSVNINDESGIYPDHISPRPTETYAAVINPVAEDKPTIKDLLVSKAFDVSGVKSLPTATPEIKRQKIHNFWDVAYLATLAYNRLFDKDVKLKEKFDDSGILVAVNFQSELIDFEKKIK